MGQFSIRFPDVCCWCGTRATAEKKHLTLTGRANRQRVRVSFQAPACRECAEYADAMTRVDTRYTLIIYAISFVITLLLTAPFLFQEGLDGDVLVAWPIVSIFVAVLVMIVLGIVLRTMGVERRFKVGQIGEPPAGYASDSGYPATLTGLRTMRFYNEDYHRQFAAVNPDLVREEDR